MARKRALPNQFTAALHLVCQNAQCGHEFFKEQAWLRQNHAVICPACGQVVAADDDEILRLRSQQVKNISDGIGKLRRENAKEGE